MKTAARMLLDAMEDAHIDAVELSSRMGRKLSTVWRILRGKTIPKPETISEMLQAIGASRDGEAKIQVAAAFERADNTAAREAWLSIARTMDSDRPDGQPAIQNSFDLRRLPCYPSPLSGSPVESQQKVGEVLVTAEEYTSGFFALESNISMQPLCIWQGNYLIFRPVDKTDSLTAGVYALDVPGFDRLLVRDVKPLPDGGVRLICYDAQDVILPSLAGLRVRGKLARVVRVFEPPLGCRALTRKD